MPIVEAQIIQETLDRVRVRYVPASDFTRECGEQVIDEIRARLGQIEVVLEPTDRIPRGANGKFRAVISRVHAATESLASIEARRLALAAGGHRTHDTDAHGARTRAV